MKTLCRLAALTFWTFGAVTFIAGAGAIQVGPYGGTPLATTLGALFMIIALCCLTIGTLQFTLNTR